MRFSAVFATLLSAYHAAAQTFSATGPNPIISPAEGASIAAGKPTTITWTPTTPGTVAFTLRYGPSKNLAAGTVIASGVENSGSYTWAVPQDIGSGSYTVEVKGSDGVANYSPTFSVTGGTGTQGGSTSGSATPTSKSSTKTSASSTASDSSTTSDTSSSTKSSNASSSTSSSTARSSSSTTSSAATKAPSNAAVPMRAAGGLAALGLGAFAFVV